MQDQVVVSRFLEAVARLPGTCLPGPASSREIDRVEAFAGVRLPAQHRALLLAVNGLTANWGYSRIFGVGDGAQDVGPWNAHETWKFTWPERLDDFLAIGQTGWGDQFAYRISELRRGIECVYVLDGLVMEPSDTPLAGDFGSFLDDFAARAVNPDEKVQEARRQVGDLGPGELAVFSPPPLLVGLERATQLTKMPARSAMTVGGDLKTQLLDPANQTREVAGFDTHLDERGRLRIQTRWVRQIRAVGDDDPELDESTI
jgi:hypothetical protein